jgi:hypothetical protein
MCRNIKQLRRPDDLPGEEEIELAALQFVRKVSGYRAPSRKNKEAFERAVEEIAAATRALIERIHHEETKVAKKEKATAEAQSR